MKIFSIKNENIINILMFFYLSFLSFFLFDKKSSEYTQFVKDNTIKFQIKLISIVVLDVKHKLHSR